MVAGIYALPHRVGHTLQLLHTLAQVDEAVLALNVVGGVGQGPQLGPTLLQHTKVLVLLVNAGVDWALQALQVLDGLVNFSKLVLVVDVVDRAHQVLDVVGQLLYLHLYI